jgi:hypothetical protein
MVMPLTRSSELRAPSCAITQHTVASSKKRKAMPLALVARSPQAQTGFNQLQLPSALSPPQISSTRQWTFPKTRPRGPPAPPGWPPGPGFWVS